MIPLWLAYDTVSANPSFSISLFIFVFTGAKSLDWEELCKKRMYSHISHQGPNQVIASNDLLKCVGFFSSSSNLIVYYDSPKLTFLPNLSSLVSLWYSKKRFVDDDECFPSLETRDSVHNQIKVWTRLPFISIFTVSSVLNRWEIFSRLAH